MKRLAIGLAAAMVVPSIPARAQGGCYDLAKGQPSVLTGRLDYVVFAGPPNFEDVQRGDTPEPSYVLTVPTPICLRGDADFADPATRFRRVQIVASATLLPSFRRLLGRPVTIHLRDAMAAETGHHHEPLVAWATAIAPAAPGASAPRPMTFVDEYGTAATTVRTFYEVLGDGQGAAAAQMIVPEKRASAAFSPAALTRFYGGLVRPVRLLSIARASAGSYLVRYSYATRTRACAGRAMVTTVNRAGRAYIAGIRALDGC